MLDSSSETLTAFVQQCTVIPAGPYGNSLGEIARGVTLPASEEAADIKGRNILVDGEIARSL